MSLIVERNELFRNALGSIFLDQEGVDCWFRLPNTSEPAYKTTGAHKVILTSASPIFKQLFETEWKDKAVIELEDITYQSFMWMLWIIYKQSIEEMPDTYSKLGFYARDVYQAAQKFGCELVLSRIRDAFKKHLTNAPDSACVWFEMSQVYDDQEIRNACIDAFIEFPANILLSDRWTSVRPATIAFIFKLDPLNIPDEIWLVCALERYLKCNQRYTMNDPYILDAKSKIRFFLLTKPQIYSTFLLNSDEKAAILYCFDNVYQRKVMKPFHISVNTVPRQKSTQRLNDCPKNPAIFMNHVQPWSANLG